MAEPDYNEEAVLKDYVIKYFSRLMTTNELLGFKAVHADSKALEAEPEMARVVRGRWGSEDNPEVQAALHDGPEAFRDAVFKRLMSEHPEEIFINRCPSCDKICRTPRAKQCRWCYHDWHNS